jgi:glycosyltransferase involved in cell wall biosynthesis
MTRQGGVRGRYLGYCEVGRRFAQAVTRSMKARRTLPNYSVFYGFDTESLEVMEHLKKRGVFCILFQIDPCQEEVEMVQAEQQVWPGWEDQPLDIPEEFFTRHKNEWASADRVVVPSEFCRRGLMQQGVPGAKITVIPLSYEIADTSKKENLEGTDDRLRKTPKSFTRENPLRVLFLGQVMLRKGIQHLVQAAESLQDCPVVFDVVGSIRISAKAVSLAPPNVVFHGRVTSDKINGWYRRANVFVLPTLSDSFAITQIEAMANGLPVIATPNCGTVVSDGVDGFIVPPRAPQSLAQAIRRYLQDPNCLENQHHAALLKSKQFSLERFGTNLLALGHQIHSQDKNLSAYV